MTGLRECAQCGKAFAPRREHARFCSPSCRRAWNTEQNGPAAAPAAAIDWSAAALADAVGRLERSGTWEPARAAAAVSETVWQVTLLDATLVRYHRRDYESAMARLGPDLRRETEESLSGLRYVRNQLGRPGSPADPAEFVRPGGGASWIWSPRPEPPLKDLTEDGRDWEMSRYRAYQNRLAGRDIIRVFARCADFLQQVAAAVPGELSPSAVAASADRSYS